MNIEDEFGGLSKVDLNLNEFAEFEIGNLEFEDIWNGKETNTNVN